MVSILFAKQYRRLPDR